MAKVMVSIPDELLSRIDREASRRDSSRSRFLQDAARRQLGHPDPETAYRAVSEARAALAGSVSLESADLIRAERDALDERDRARM